MLNTIGAIVGIISGVAAIVSAIYGFWHKIHIKKPAELLYYGLFGRSNTTRIELKYLLKYYVPQKFCPVGHGKKEGEDWTVRQMLQNIRKNPDRAEERYYTKLFQKILKENPHCIFRYSIFIRLQLCR